MHKEMVEFGSELVFCALDRAVEEGPYQQGRPEEGLGQTHFSRGCFS